MIIHRNYDPWEYSGYSKSFEDEPENQQIFVSKGLSQEHLETVGYISNSLSMSFSLPESSLDIRAVPVTSANVDLVEGNIDRSRLDGHPGFPVSFYSCMEVLSYSIGTGIPIAYSFY